MAKHSKETLNAFQAKLESVDRSWQTNFSLREVVRESFHLIQSARNYKVSWEQIATLLQESSGTEATISPDSIRQYYFECAKQPELLPKPKRKRSGSKDKLKPATSPIPASTMAPNHSPSGSIAPEARESQPADEVTRAPEPIAPPPPAPPDIQSQFNLRRRSP